MIHRFDRTFPGHGGIMEGPVREFVIGISGESGEGVVLTGEFLTIAAARMNIHSSSFRTFPAEARGGPSVVRLRLARDHVYSLGDEYDVLVAFNEEAYQLHGPDLANHGVLLVDGEPEKPIITRYPELHDRVVYHVPMERIARKDVGEIKTKNMVALGAVSALFGFSRELIERQIAEKFKKRSEKMLRDNINAFTPFARASASALASRSALLPLPTPTAGINHRIYFYLDDI